MLKRCSESLSYKSRGTLRANMGMAQRHFSCAVCEPSSPAPRFHCFQEYEFEKLRRTEE